MTISAEPVLGFIYAFLDKFTFLFDEKIQALTVISNLKNKKYIIITFIHSKKSKIIGQIKFYLITDDKKQKSHIVKDGLNIIKIEFIK